MNIPEWLLALPSISGFLTLLAAIIGAVAVLRASRARAREAVSAEFQDQMQWAAKYVGDSSKPYEQAFALMLIDRYAHKPPKLLGAEDLEIAQQMQDIVARTLDITGFPPDSENSNGVE